jgi:AcrR family transcriptional regulator
MSGYSGLSTISRRIPQQERGERRVTELLDAAADVLSEVGYESATMKAIAKRASASIGAVYQYFPNKEALVRALRSRYSDELEQRWTNLEEATASLSVKQLAQRFVDVMVRFMEEHPAYIKILDVPAGYKRDPKARDHLRERIADVFRARRPTLSSEQAYRVANVSLQIIKSMNALYAQADPKARLDIVKEYKLNLTAYLELRLTP